MGILTLVLRTATSRVRDECGVVEKALKNRLSPSTLASNASATAEVLFQPASGIHVTSVQIERVYDVYIRKNSYANCVCVCVRWPEHVSGGSGAHDEGTGGVSSICNEDHGGSSTIPRCHCASVARKCCSSRKTFNLHMHASLTFFVHQVGCLTMCRIRSLGSYPAHSVKNWWLRQECIWPQSCLL